MDETLEQSVELPTFDTGEQLKNRFGVEAGQIVTGPDGTQMMVIGIHNGELYFDAGRYALSYWKGYERTDFDAAGFVFEAANQQQAEDEQLVAPVASPSVKVGVFKRVTDSAVNRLKELASSGVPIKIEDQEQTAPEEVYLPIEIDENNQMVSILDVQVPLGQGGERVPNLEKKLLEYTLDERTLDLLSKIATAVQLRDPCMLSGEPATSKTSGIELLAGLTNHEFDLISLNGAADTSDLIGKFVPNDENSQARYEALLAKPEELKQESRQIIENAAKEGRELTLEECRSIASSEGLQIDDSDWRWLDGKIPTAMKRGQWIVLDEVNLAETQILERINSVLGRFPSLVIPEHKGETISHGGDFELHPDFRIFSTGNPAEDQGRNPLSPAYRDRWTSSLYVDNPTEDQLLSMMVLGVFGEHPLVKINGSMYRALDIEPRYPSLANVPNIREIIQLVAKFHFKIAEMADKKNREIGKSKREPYMFTRRVLTEFLEYIGEFGYIDRKTRSRVTIFENPQEIINRAIEQYYLGKITDPEDITKIKDLLSAIGISRDNWVVGEADADGETSDEEVDMFYQDFDENGIWYDRDGNEVVATSRRGIEQNGKIYEVGQKFIVSENADDEILQKLDIVVGEGLVYAGSIRPQDGSPENFVFLRRNGDAVLVYHRDYTDSQISLLLKHEIIQPYKDKNVRSFVGYNGNNIESNGETKKWGLKIGDSVRPIKGGMHDIIYEAKKLTIVGFTEDDKVIIQMDDDKVFVTMRTEVPIKFELTS